MNPFLTTPGGWAVPEEGHKKRGSLYVHGGKTVRNGFFLPILSPCTQIKQKEELSGEKCLLLIHWPWDLAANKQCSSGEITHPTPSFLGGLWAPCCQASKEEGRWQQGAQPTAGAIFSSRGNPEVICHVTLCEALSLVQVPGPFTMSLLNYCIVLIYIGFIYIHDSSNMAWWVKLFNSWLRWQVL